MNRPWRDEVEDARKAEQLARNTREASRQADLYCPSGPPITEDEDGFVVLANYRIPGMVWSSEHATVEDDDEPLRWLTG